MRNKSADPRRSANVDAHPSRTPLKSLRKARAPGESLFRQFDTELAFNVAYCAGVSIAFIGLAAQSWFNHLRQRDPHPMGMTLAAALVLVASAFRIWIVFKRLRRTKRGAEGERAVGTLLDDLRKDGYRVFHDLELTANGTTFNADHVMAGPAGVFVIETKYVSKSGHAAPCIRAEGNQVLINGSVSARDPIAQVVNISKEVGTRLQERTGFRPPVIPVVAFPGCLVDASPNCEAWVMNPKQIFTVRRKRQLLSDQQIEQIALALEWLDSQRKNW